LPVTGSVMPALHRRTCHDRSMWQAVITEARRFLARG